MSNPIKNLSVTTTAGETFTGEEHSVLAFIILRRFGYDYEAAANGWRRLFQNNCPDHDFEVLADHGRTLT